MYPVNEYPTICTQPSLCVFLSQERTTALHLLMSLGILLPTLVWSLQVHACMEAEPLYQFHTEQKLS